MRRETIGVSAREGQPRPNMGDYDAERRAFSWESARRAMQGLPGGRGLNIAHEAVDRHAAGPGRAAVALRCVPRRGPTLDVTYGDLAERSSRFANVLAGLGVQRGDRVFTLLPRTADMYVVAMGTLKHRAVLSPLFTAFGPEPVRQRIELGDGRVLVTTYALYRRKVMPILDRLPGLRHVLLAGDANQAPGQPAGPNRPPKGTLDLRESLDAADAAYTIGPTDPEDMALVHFTSGTTGTPKGAVHVHDAVLGHHATGRIALDLHPGDVFWCTADPGWVTGTSYGIVSPLVNGVTAVVDEGDFDPERWYRLIERERVNVWYTAPTALRMLRQAGTEMARAHDLGSLRLVASVGEPLDAELVQWGGEAFGLPVHDTWWQTETGGIMIANFRSMEVRPGSMGRPLPGVEAAVLRLDGRGALVHRADGGAVEAGPGERGELALRPGWPSMFRGYLGDDERYRRCFSGGWYLTGDLVRCDADGYYWFVGRSDDVIESAGHLIGPFEVEAALLEHPAVAEAGVVGKPDPVSGEVVKAYVTLRPGFAPGDDLRRELLGFARTRLGAAVAPREITFDQHLPHTESGKIVRRILKARDVPVTAGGGEAEGGGMAAPGEQR